MKKSHLTFSSLILVAVMSSCLNGKYETTPQIQIDSRIFINHTDTIGIFYNIKESKYSTDTLYVGDSATIIVAFDAIGNNITAGQINYEAQYATISVDGIEELGNIIIPSISDSSYRFTVAQGYRAVMLAVNYVPVKAGRAQIDFIVESDSEYSPSALSLLTPIADKPTN